MSERDDLLASAVAYNQIRGYKYLIRLMLKGKDNIDLDLRFEPENFYHLAGLQYVNIVPKLKGKSQVEVFSEILQGEITLSDLYDTTDLSLDKAHIVQKNYQENVSGRLVHLKNLEGIIDQCEHFFTFEKEKLGFPSKIEKFNEVILSLDRTETIFTFVGRDTKTRFDFCGSFFPKRHLDYTQNQTYYYLRIKVKVRIADSAITCLKRHRNVSDEELDMFCSSELV
jgi:hypothetical protein